MASRSDLQRRQRPVKNFQRQTVVGNNALQLNEAPVYAPTKPAGRTEVKADANFAKINMLCTIMLVLMIVATAAVCILYLNALYTNNDLNVKIEDSKASLQELRRENAQLEDNLSEEIDLEKVYQVATAQLGMKLPEPGDVYYIKDNPLTYTAQYAPIQSEQPRQGMDSVLGYFMNGWGRR